MPLRPPAFELALTHLVLTAGLLAARLAYGSGDPSGLQYMFLPVAAVFVVIAGLLAGFIRLQGLRVPRSTSVLIGGALAAAVFPYVFGFGWDSSRIDAIGFWVATVLLGIQALVIAVALYRWHWAAT